MVAPDGVIDLDRLAPEPPASRPVHARRRILVAAVLALTLLAVAGAAAPPPPAVTLVRTAWIAEDAAYRVLGDALYVTEGRTAPRLTAYPLAGARPRWSTPIAVQGTVELTESGDVVLVTGILPGPPLAVHTEALDRGTGAVRWTSALWLLAVDRVRGRVVLGDVERVDLVEVATAGDVVAVAAGTGSPVWTYRRPPECLTDLPDPVTDPVTPLAVLCADETLTAVDLGTGSTRTTTRVGPTGVILGDPAPSVVGALADRILVSYPVEQGGWSVASYDPATLRPQWTLHLRFSRPGVAPCGPRLCLSNPPDLVALEPATGAVAWQLSALGGLTPLAGGHLLVDDPDRVGPRLIDSGTGRVAATLNGWTAAPPLFYRSDTGNLWVAALDPGRSALRLLGSVPEPAGAPAACATAGRYLFCRTVKDAVEVWRIEPAG